MAANEYWIHAPKRPEMCLLLHPCRHPANAKCVGGFLLSGVSAAGIAQTIPAPQSCDLFTTPWLLITELNRLSNEALHRVNYGSLPSISAPCNYRIKGSAKARKRIAPEGAVVPINIASQDHACERSRLVKKEFEEIAIASPPR